MFNQNGASVIIYWLYFLETVSSLFFFFTVQDCLYRLYLGNDAHKLLRLRRYRCGLSILGGTQLDSLLSPHELLHHLQGEFSLSTVGQKCRRKKRFNKTNWCYLNKWNDESRGERFFYSRTSKCCATAVRVSMGFFSFFGHFFHFWCCSVRLKRNPVVWTE